MPMGHRLLSAVALAMLSASTFAATTVYTTSASFLASIAPGSYTETFTGLSVGDALPVAFSGGGMAYNISAPGGLYSDGTLLGTNQIAEPLTINFTSGNVRAVGGNFFHTDINPDFQPVAVTLTLSDGTTTTFTPTSMGDSYRGFISSVNITSLVMSAPDPSLYASVDNLTVAVPEPSTWLMMGLGLSGLLVVARKRAA